MAFNTGKFKVGESVRVLKYPGHEPGDTGEANPNG